MTKAYDVVGDVHGMIRTLSRLVNRLGYVHDGDSWSHPQKRQLVFVGDLIDRGPDPLGCLEMVEDLVEDGAALMILGNHELNALHYMEDPPLRKHTENHKRQFAATLSQIEAIPSRWERARTFLMKCPTRLELGGLRVIHACWHPETVDQLPVYINSPELLRRTSKSGDLIDAVENCMKGPEGPCEPFQDNDGRWRERRRLPWWHTYESDKLVAFGHYWFPWKGAGKKYTPATPELLGPDRNAACVDYNAGSRGPLVALRYPERTLVQVECCDDQQEI